MTAGFEIELLVDPRARGDELAILRTRWAIEQGRSLDTGDSFPHEFAAWLDREQTSRKFWIASMNDAPIGMVNLLVFDRMPTVGRPSGGWGYLCNMFVDEANRNRGLGAQLAGALLDYADSIGLERVVLSPSERSRPFYATLGFGPADNLLVRNPTLDIDLGET